MYLKRLEIQGFKTFPSRTVLEFGPGITAIIGPNGSGKSNVADAIRWVLGEQSPRLMRLRRMEDALYAGGSRRPPSGFAEVTIWLDNTGGWLPLAFSEVAVTRRLHRSGDTDYLINRQRVRLRDVNELFLKARLGQNSYAIMGQGLVDQVLSLRPEERRALIEEAADIRRYRIRTQDATDRLAQARAPQEKAALLIAELAPRLQQLERQARRAQEHQQLASELATANHQWFRARLRVVDRALAAAQQESLQSRSALTAAQAAVTRQEQILAALADALSAARRAEQPAVARLRAADDDLHRREQQLTLESERLTYVQRRVSDVEEEVASLTTERQALRTAIAEAAEVDATRLAAAQQETGRLEVALRAAGEQIERTRAGVREVDAEHERRARALRLLDEQIAGARQSLARAEQDCAEGSARRRRLLHRLAGYATAFHASWQVLGRARNSLDLAERSQEQAQAACDAARFAAESAAATLARATSELETMSRRAAGLEQLQADLHRLDSRRQGLEAMAATGIAVIGRLTDTIQVENGMDTAVEAALGDALAAVLVPGHAGDAVERLQAAGSPRMALLPVAPASACPPAHAGSRPGVIGPAAALVTCRPEYRHTLNRLLAGILVVADDATARVISGEGATAVTLTGTVYRANGLILTRDADSGSQLALERELRALPQQLTHARTAAEVADREHTAAQRTLAKQRQWLAEAGRAVEQARRVRLKAQEALMRERSGLAPVRGDLRHAARITSSAQGKLGPLRAEEQRISALRDPAHAAAAAAEQQAYAARRELQRLTAAREQVLHDWAAARAVVAALEREHQATTALRESRRVALIRLDDRIAARTREAETRRTEIIQVTADLARQRQELAALRALRREAAEAAHHAREQSRTLSAQLQAAEPEMAALRRALAAAERLVFQAEGELAQRTDERSRLLESMAGEGLTPPCEAETSRDRPANAETVLSEQEISALHERIRAIRQRIRSLGPVNPLAGTEYAAGRRRHDDLAQQTADVRAAEANVLALLEVIQSLVQTQFRDAFNRISAGFAEAFTRFFGGGAAQLVLTAPERGIESGIEISARPPGKRQQSLALLSGGERSMTAVALLFALLQFNPAPFCVLDEVDAAMDEANVTRFGQALSDLTGQTQFVVVTHNRVTMEAAGTLYGVSMGKDGASSVLSLRLADIPET